MKINIKDIVNQPEGNQEAQKKVDLKGDDWFTNAVEEAETEARQERDPLLQRETAATPTKQKSGFAEAGEQAEPKLVVDAERKTKADPKIEMESEPEVKSEPNPTIEPEVNTTVKTEVKLEPTAEGEAIPIVPETSENEAAAEDPAIPESLEVPGTSDFSEEPENSASPNAALEEAEIPEESAEELEAAVESELEPDIKEREQDHNALEPEPKTRVPEIREPEPQIADAEHDEMPEALSSCADQTEKSFWKLYGGIFAIGASFVVLIVAMILYTLCTPRTVYAEIDGVTTEIESSAYTIEKFLESQHIAYCEEDFISVPLTAYVHDGMELSIEHAKDVTVTADGKKLKFKTLKPTVAEALADQNVTVNELDLVTPERTAAITNDMEIVIQRVVVKRETRTEAVKFKTKEKNDDTLEQGKTKVVQEGKDGEDEVTYDVTYTDGKETARKEVKRKTIEKPTDKIIAKGTKFVFDGKAYSRKLTVKAYSYTGGGRTAMGTRARVGEIAVDPRVIPLGSEVYIVGVGTRRAEDTGGNIKGNTIDIYKNTAAECRSWGVRYVTIYIK